MPKQMLWILPIPSRPEYLKRIILRRKALKGKDAERGVIVVKRGWREPAAFLAATFALSWLFWFGAYLHDTPGATLLIMMGTAIPSALGLLCTYLFEGKPKLKALIGSALRVKALKIWWFYSVLLFPVILLCACLIFMISGGVVPPAQFPIWFLPIAFVYIFACMGPLGEELGWRGFLLRYFLCRWSAAKSEAILGFIWSVWHFPLFFISGTIQYEIAKTGLFIAVAGYFIYTICVSMLITILYIRTQGNLFLCMVFHTICNLSLGVAPIILNKRGAVILLITFIMVTFVVRKVTEKIK